MDGVHDMGGMHGFGSIERDEPPYHEEWELRVHAMSNAMASGGGGRYALESLEPATYLASSYYERWLLARINTLLAEGLITGEELATTMEAFTANPDAAMPQDDSAAYEQAFAGALAKRRKDGDSPFPPGSGSDHASVPPDTRFKIGDHVRAKKAHPDGHSRLPRYVRGREGIVIDLYRPQVFQDHEPLSDHIGPQPIYAVRFAGKELWGEQAEANSSVVLDMWEAYLE